MAAAAAESRAVAAPVRVAARSLARAMLTAAKDGGADGGPHILHRALRLSIRYALSEAVESCAGAAALPAAPDLEPRAMLQRMMEAGEHAHAGRFVRELGLVSDKEFAGAGGHLAKMAAAQRGKKARRRIPT